MPYVLQLIFFILFCIGAFLLIPKKKIDYSFSFTGAEAKVKRNRINSKDTLTKLDKLKIRIEALLKKMDKDMNYFYVITGICFAIGFVVGLICFGGVFLPLATAITFSPASYLFIVFKTQEATREELAELQNAMGVITNAYLSNNNIIKAVESYITEKNRYLTTEERALKKITPFEEFITQCTYINPNVDAALETLAAKINNKYFDQWVKNLRLCLENRDMKFSLEPVIKQMADEKILQMESDAIMRKTWQNYFTMLALMFSVILIFRITNRSWYLILVGTPAGKFIVLLMLISAILSAIFVVRLNKPISTT